MPGLGEVLELLNKLIDLEKSIEGAIKNEKDKRRRKKIKKAIKKRDVKKVRELLFIVRAPDND